MNAALRRRHRVLFGALALVVPTCFALALLGRDEVAKSSVLPADPRASGALEPLAAGAGRMIELHADDAAWTARIDGGLVALAQSRGAARPDLHAYWTAESVLDELPEDALHLGAVARAERTFALPGRAGTLVLFSLAHGEVVARGSLGEAR